MQKNYKCDYILYKQENQEEYFHLNLVDVYIGYLGCAVRLLNVLGYGYIKKRDPRSCRWPVKDDGKMSARYMPARG